MSGKQRARGFAIGTVVAILWLTLTPELRQGAHPTPSPWCFHCGDGDSVDVLLNLLLFVPLGSALAWLGLRRFPALVLAIALTIAIEVTQFFFIPGRDGSIRDVLCNASGAAIGFALAPLWRDLLVPPLVVAHRLFVGALLFWLGLAALSSWGLGGTSPGGEWWVQLDPHGLGSVDFPGRLLSADFDGVRLENGRIEDPAAFKGVVADHDIHNRLTLASGGPVIGTAPIFGLVTDAPIEVVRLSQRDDDALYRFDVRGYGAGLVVPVYALPHTFRVAGDSIEWQTEYDGKSILLAARHAKGGEQRWRTAITPNQGWQLFWPFEPRRPDQAMILTMLWAAILPGLAGYYAAFREVSLRGNLLALALALSIAGFLLPLVGGIAAVTPLEFLAACSGIAAGGSIGTLVRARA